MEITGTFPASAKSFNVGSGSQNLKFYNSNLIYAFSDRPYWYKKMEKKKKELFILISSKDIAIRKQFCVTINSLLHFLKFTLP